MKKRKKKKIPNIFEKAFVAWIKYDPIVSTIVKNDDIVRKQIMLNLLGKNTANKYFSDVKGVKVDDALILPNTVRDAVEKDLHDDLSRKQLIQNLIYWATDSNVNNAFIQSQLTRMQIVRSLLGPVFFHATKKQEVKIMQGLKYMLVHKKTVIGEEGEQSPEVHRVLLEKISDILIHNQKVIINQAVREAEEKMRVNLIRQIQELSGEKHSAPVHSLDLNIKVKKIVKEKFPLEDESKQHLEDMLLFYKQSNWPEFKQKASKASEKLRSIRKPLTLTS